MLPRLLPLSSSRAGRTGYLEHAQPLIREFTAACATTLRRALFVPFAAEFPAITAKTASSG